VSPAFAIRVPSADASEKEYLAGDIEESSTELLDGAIAEYLSGKGEVNIVTPCSVGPCGNGSCSVLAAASRNGTYF